MCEVQRWSDSLLNTLHVVLQVDHWSTPDVMSLPISPLIFVLCILYLMHNWSIVPHHCSSKVTWEMMADDADLRPWMKRKWVVLISPLSLTTRYGVGTSTISDISRMQRKFYNFGERDEQINKKYLCWWVWGARKFIWLKQKWVEGIGVTGSLYCKKALELSKMIYSNDMRFSASEGWRWTFSKRLNLSNMLTSCLQIGLLQRATWSHS